MAAARYPETSLEPISTKIFRKEDEFVYTHVVENDIPIEYEQFMPVVPLALINGVEGLGCGWSTKIPNHNPLDILRYVRTWVTSKEEFDDLPHLTPWYRGFTGTITVEVNELGVPTHWYSKGILSEEIGKNKKPTGWWIISEAPIGLWTYKLKEFLEKLLIPDSGGTKYLTDMKEEYTANTVRFLIKPTKDYIPDIDTKGNLSILKSKHSLTNMVLIDEHHRPRKYASAKEIIDFFSQKRLNTYTLRKTQQLKDLAILLKKARNKYLFVKLVVDKVLELNQEDESLSEDMRKHALETIDGSYDYLLGMQMRSMTKKRLGELEKESAKLTEQIRNLDGMTETQIWLWELDEFEKAYQVFLKTRVEEVLV
jgi:DNA topoisomerase-2